MAYDPKDYFFHKAKKENYVARSVFKIQEIDQKFKIFRSGMKILDLGAAPGSWSQYASEKVGLKGRVLGIDIQPIKLTMPNSIFVTADMRGLDVGRIMAEHGIAPPFDIVLSDMAPKTTGIRITDQVRSFDLCELALQTAERFLKPNGSFVTKLFHSEEFDVFRKLMKARFKKIDFLRPKSTRTESKEIFCIGQGFKPPAAPKASKTPAPSNDPET